jgi:hypothetical protein
MQLITSFAKIRDVKAPQFGYLKHTKKLSRARYPATYYTTCNA